MESIESDGIGSSGLHPLVRGTASLVKGSAAAEEVAQHLLKGFPQLQAAATGFSGGLIPAGSQGYGLPSLFSLLTSHSSALAERSQSPSGTVSTPPTTPSRS
ncbi:MAG: hypothetical protein AAFR61_21755 [Bacteroidota bacterium]